MHIDPSRANSVAPSQPKSDEDNKGNKTNLQSSNNRDKSPVGKILIAAVTAAIIIAAVAMASMFVSSIREAELANQQQEATEQMMLEVNDTEADEGTQSNPLYPTGWIAYATEGVPLSVGDAVEVTYLPGIDIHPRVNGDIWNGASTLPGNPSMASVEVGGQTYSVEPQSLLVNLPDIIPNALYDIRYAYDTPSKSGGHDIEGLTHATLPGYQIEDVFDAYLDRNNRPAPVAVETALKLLSVNDYLTERGYKLVVWDAYRPYQASRFISDKFTQAYNSSPEIREAVGNQWSLDWYAADGTSGHNYGTDIDVSIANAEGQVLAMPSDFDAFDESAHLVDIPMNSASITSDKYREAVKSNEACMVLHEAFLQAGFGELASEWWHFQDDDAENALRMRIGNEGLDFEARLAQ